MFYATCIVLFILDCLLSILSRFDLSIYSLFAHSTNL